jgi:hypothetical protein
MATLICVSLVLRSTLAVRWTESLMISLAGAKCNFDAPHYRARAALMKASGSQLRQA